jgi:acetyl-CoA carboxylase biotin carboxyl carrier protein
MDLEEIREILKFMEENGLAEFELERDGFRIALRKAVASAPAMAAVPIAQPVPAAAGAIEAGKLKDEERASYIRSPMVGTFYVAPSPDSPPFVNVGEDVGKDDVVCILEAMKVMNEIKAEVEGRIAEVLVENGEPVEYGQPLFRVEVA